MTENYNELQVTPLDLFNYMTPLICTYLCAVNQLREMTENYNELQVTTLGLVLSLYMTPLTHPLYLCILIHPPLSLFTITLHYLTLHCTTSQYYLEIAEGASCD